MLQEASLEEKEHAFLESDKGRLKHDDSPRDRDEDIMPKRTGKILTVVKARAREYSQHAREALMGAITTLNPTKHSPTATSFAVQCRPVRSSQHTDISNISVSSTQIIDEWIRKAAMDPPHSEDSARDSGTTTSTGRVLSFQQMYAFYGIEEPADSFPAKESEPDAVPRQAPAGKRKCCHICRWINGDIDRCACCGHRLCGECEEMDPATDSDKKGDGGQEFDIFEDEDDVEETSEKIEDARAEGELYTPSEDEQENREGKSFVAAHARRISFGQSPTSKQPPLLIPAADASSILKEVILVPIAEPAEMYRKSSVIAPFTKPAAILKEVPSVLPQPLQESKPAASSTLPDIDALDAPSSLPSPLPLVRATLPKKHSTVKNSPFVIADQLSSAHKPVFQARKVVQLAGHRGDGSKHGHRSHSSPEPIQSRHDLRRRQLYGGSKAIEHNVDSNAAHSGCEDPSCRASQAGYRADRRSVSWESDATVGCDSPNCRATVTRHLPYHHTVSGTGKRRGSKVADRVPPYHSVSKGLRMAAPLMSTTHAEKVKFELGGSEHAHPTAEIRVDTPAPLHSYDEGPDEVKFSVLWKQAMYSPSPYRQTIQSGHVHPSQSVDSYREDQNHAHQSTPARHEQSSYSIPARHIPPPPPSLVREKRSTTPSSSYHSLSPSAASTQHHHNRRSKHTDTDAIDGHASSRLCGESPRLAQTLRPSHPRFSARKQEMQRAVSLPELLSPAPKRMVGRPKWISLQGAEEEVGCAVGGKLERMREGVGGVVGGDGGTDVDVRSRSSLGSGERERMRRSDAPSPGSGGMTDATASAVTAAERVEEVEEVGMMSVDVAGRTRVSVRVVPGGGEGGGDGDGEVEGVSIVVHLRGEGDVVLEVGLKRSGGVVRRG